MSPFIQRGTTDFTISKLKQSNKKAFILSDINAPHQRTTSRLLSGIHLQSDRLLSALTEGKYPNVPVDVAHVSHHSEVLYVFYIELLLPSLLLLAPPPIRLPVLQLPDALLSASSIHR